MASGIGDAAEARQWLRTKLKAVGEKAGFPGILGEGWGTNTLSTFLHLFWYPECGHQEAWQLCPTEISSSSWGPQQLGALQVPSQSSCGQIQGWTAIVLARQKNSAGQSG